LERNGYSVCNLCWDICPAGSYSHRDLFVMRITRSGPLSRVADWVGLIQEDAGIDGVPGPSGGVWTVTCD
jgi:hypothetical protein